MRTYRGLFERLCDPDHLDRAAVLTTRGKRRRPDVAWFLFRREEELCRLRDLLASERWRPEGFDLITIKDPKPRLIARVPIRERVVHRALVELLQPIFLRRALPDAFACRPGFGTHRAVLRLLELVRRFSFVAHLDVRSYFPSIDRSMALALVARHVRDRPFLRTIRRALEAAPTLYDDPGVRHAARLDPDWPPTGRGLPIGSSLSQLLAAHVVLGDLDHFAKRRLKIPGYVRYVDDFFVFGDRRADLRHWRAEIGGWLWNERSLRLKHPEARVLSCRGHLDALGVRITREGTEPRQRGHRRLEKHVRGWLAGSPAARRVDLRRSVASRAGLLLF